jgi:hypothetical protein
MRKSTTEQHNYYPSLSGGLVLCEQQKPAKWRVFLLAALLRKEEKKQTRTVTEQQNNRTPTKQRLHNDVSLKTKAAPTNLSS